MFKSFKKKSRQIHSIFTIFLLLFQNIAPLFLIPSPAFAATTQNQNISQVTLAFNQDSHELTVQGQADENVNYLITYQDSNGDSLQEAITGQVESIDNQFKETIYVGTCSDEECISNDIDHGTLSFANSNYQADFNIENNILWLNNNNISTVAKVTTGTTYVAPQNNQVTINFTSLPENSGTLSIEEIILSDEQVESLSALSNVAYDITSTMENGTFEYNLTLPLPERNNKNIKVVYADNVNDLSTGEELTNTIEGNEIIVESVDHFTVFVVTSNPGTDCSGGIYAAGVCYDNLQTAVDDASVGDTIDILSNITVGHRVDLNKALTINGHGFTISPNFTKTTNSNNASLGIFEDNTIIQNLMIDGTNGTDLHGINIYVANNVLLDNVTVSNNRAGVVVNGSIVTAHNITTSGNAWGGINIDQGTGVTTEAKLIVTGNSSHDEATHLWLDDITKNVSVDDTVGQYSYIDYGNTRVYTFKDIIAPAQPTGIRILNNLGENLSCESFTTQRRLTIDWDDNTETDFNNYEYQIREERTIAYPTVSELTGNIRNEDGYYKYRVRAVDSSDNASEWSNWCGVTLDREAPEAPTLITPLDNSRVNGSILLSDWSNPIDAVSYIYESYHDENANNLRWHAEYTQSEKSANNVSESTFWWRVKAVDEAGNESSWSNLWKVTIDNTAPAMPADLRLIGGDGNEYQCSDYSLRQFHVPTWNDNTEVDFSHYEYSSFHPSGAQGLNEKILTVSKLQNTWMPPTDGTYGFAVRAVDNTGNKSAWSINGETLTGSCQINYDSVAPTTPEVLGFVNPSLNCGSITNIHNTTVDWTDSTDSGVGFANYEYFINYPKPDGSRGQWSTTRSTSQYGGSLNEGTHIIKVRAKDVLGNTSDWSNTCSITTDWQAPDVEVTNPISGLVNGTVDLRGSVEDDNPHHYWLVVQDSNGKTVAGPGVVNDTNSFTDQSLLSWDTTLVNDGTYTIKLEARDSADNKDAGSSHWLEVEVDNSNPVTTLSSPSNDDETNKDILIEGSSTDTNSVSEVNLYYSVADENNWQLITTISNTGSDEPFAFSYDWTPSTEGSYDLKAAGTDNVGNVENSAYIYDITYDTTAPVISWNNPGASELVDGIVNLNATCDGGSTESTYVNFWWWKNSEGQSIIDARDNSPKQYNRVGRTNPNGGVVNGDIFSFDINVTDEDIIQSAYDWTGEWRLRAACKDSAGNYAHSQIDFNVDHINPSSIITSYGLDNGGEVQTAIFDGLVEGTASDDHSGVDHVLLSISHLEFGADEIDTKYWDATSSAFVNTTSTFRAVGTTLWDYKFSEIPEGIYNITSHAVDVAGNVETTYSIKVVFDKTIPEVELIIDPTSPDGEKGWYRYINPTITLGASDNYILDHIGYQWNSTTGNWTTYSSPINPPNEGSHVLYYRSIDTIGNISVLGVKEVKYDTTSPSGEPLEVKVDKITSDTADATWKAPEDDSDVTFYKLSWRHEDGTSYGVETGYDDFFHQLDNLYDGVWTLSVKAMDDAGNYTEKKIDFRVGPGPSLEDNDGTVLGVTTGEGTSEIYTPFSATTDTNEDKEDTKDNPKEEEKNVAVTEEGEVLGANTCKPWSEYLPILLIMLQLITIVGFEIARRDSNSTRIIAAIVITIATIVLFYYLNNSECFTEGSWLTTITKWFTLLSIGTGLAAKLIAHTFVNEG